MGEPPEPAVRLRRGANDGARHRSLPAPRAEGRVGRPSRGRPEGNCLARELCMPRTQDVTQNIKKKRPRTFLSAVGGTASNPML